MRLLITGGAGFIGSNYVRMVLSGKLNGVTKLTILDKLTYAARKQNLEPYLSNSEIELIVGDICDEYIVNSLVKKADIVINFAAESHVDRSISNPGLFVMNNILGVQVLLDAIRNHERRFIQISTDEVYGSINNGSWSEESSLEPNSPYSASKASADLLVRSYLKTFKINACITRSSNNYGPNQNLEKLIPSAISKLMTGKKVPIYGNGLQSRDWLFVEDHCRAINLVALSAYTAEIFNIGGGTNFRNVDLIQEIASRMGVKQDFIEYVEDRKGHDYRYSIDDSKIRNSLGYMPKMSIDEGLDTVIEWYKENYEMF